MLDRLKAWASSLKAQLLALWFSRDHPDTPPSARWLAALVVAYAFSPIDFIPDFIPVLGYLDDVILVPLGIYLALRLIPEHVQEESRAKARDWIESRRGKPRSYGAALLIVLAWIALAGIGWRLLR